MASGTKENQPPTWKLGSMAAWFRLPDPRPDSPIELFAKAFIDGFAKLERLPDGRLNASVFKGSKNESQIAASVSSCPLAITMEVPCHLVITWEGAVVRLYANAILIGSTEPDDAIPPLFIWTHEEKGKGRLARPIENFEKQNEDARKRRHDSVAGRVPQRGKRPGSKERDFRLLANEVDQLKTSVSAVQSGKRSHAAGIAGIARKLIIGQSGQMGLLQRCAGRLNEMLIVFAKRGCSLPDSIKYYDGLNFAAKPHFQDGFDVSVDVDEWLKLNAGYLAGTPFTHKKILTVLGNAVGGHSDVDVHPIEEMLETLTSEMSVPYRCDLLISYLLSLPSWRDVDSNSRIHNRKRFSRCRRKQLTMKLWDVSEWTQPRRRGSPCKRRLGERTFLL